MRCTVLAFLLITLLTPEVSRSQGQTFTLSPLLSYDSFRSSGLDNGVDFGAGVGLRLAPPLMVSATLAFGSRSLRYDVIGGTQAVGGRIIALTGSLELLVLGEPGRAGVAVTLGGGEITGTVDAHTVSLGALGSITIPERSSTSGFVQGGIAGTLPVSRSIAAVILPSIRFVTPFSSSPDFSFAGGLRVGIF